jgi:uncharacterized protein involved in cysteine biosynthesis
MLHDLARAMAQLTDPATRRWVWRSAALALLLLALTATGLQLALALLAETGRAWLDWLVRGLGAVGTLIGAWLLFPAVISAVLALFLDGVVDAVERRHYPGLPAPRRQGTVEAVAAGGRLALLAILLNLVALPLYLVPGAGLAVWLGLNGYLLGREYFETVAARRLPQAEARALRRARRGEVWWGGVLVALLLLVPAVNLIAPIIGIALMTHRFHRVGRGAATDRD